MTLNNDKNKFKNPWDEQNKSKGRSDVPDINDIIKKGQERITNIFSFKKLGGGNFNNDYFSRFGPGKSLLIILLIVFIGWILTGFYIVQPDEEAVVTRVGGYNRTATAGLNYRLPAPIEKETRLSVTRVNRETIGFRQTQGTRTENMVNQNIPEESQMLTGDENIIDIDFEVQWQINNAKNYLFNVRDLPKESTVKSVAESAMREVIGRSKISDALAEGRFKIEQEATKLLQNILDSYAIGVQIIRLQMLRVNPPIEVIDAYRDVQSAKADREREINQAEAYRNDIIPRARGEAQKRIQGSEAYKEQVIASAIGDARRFDLVREKYARSRDVVTKSMFYEAMEEVLTGMNKVIIDDNIKNMIPFLPINDMFKKTSKQEVSTGQSMQDSSQNTTVTNETEQ